MIIFHAVLSSWPVDVADAMAGMASDYVRGVLSRPPGEDGDDARGRAVATLKKLLWGQPLVPGVSPTQVDRDGLMAPLAGRLSASEVRAAAVGSLSGPHIRAAASTGCRCQQNAACTGQGLSISRAGRHREPDTGSHPFSCSSDAVPRLHPFSCSSDRIPRESAPAGGPGLRVGPEGCDGARRGL